MKFLELLVVCTSVLIIPGSLSGQNSKDVTAAMVTELIIKQTGGEQVPNTVDVFKA